MVTDPSLLSFTMLGSKSSIGRGKFASPGPPLVGARGGKGRKENTLSRFAKLRAVSESVIKERVEAESKAEVNGKRAEDAMHQVLELQKMVLDLQLERSHILSNEDIAQSNLLGAMKEIETFRSLASEVTRHVQETGDKVEAAEKAKDMIEERCCDVESHISNIEGRVEELVDAQEEFIEMLNEVKEENARLTQAVDEKEHQIASHVQENETLSVTVTQLNESIASYTKQMTELQERVKEAEEKIKEKMLLIQEITSASDKNMEEKCMLSKALEKNRGDKEHIIIG